MKLLSQGAQYALSAVIVLSRQPEGTTMSAADLAKPLNCPAPYLSQVLSKLKPSGILDSKRGLNGGVLLARPPSDITLMQVVKAIDGTDFFTRCFMGIEGCGDIDPCPFHDFWASERDNIKDWLMNTTFHEIQDNMTDSWFNLRLHFPTD